jgi:hypothetical protein
MAMQAATVDILIEKAKFEPRTAVAVAEAMDEAIGHFNRHSQLVTVPVLDARLSDLKSELIRWVFLTVMGQFALITGMVYFLLQQLR